PGAATTAGAAACRSTAGRPSTTCARRRSGRRTSREGDQGSVCSTPSVGRGRPGPGREGVDGGQHVVVGEQGADVARHLDPALHERVLQRDVAPVEGNGRG